MTKKSNKEYLEYLDHLHSLTAQKMFYYTDGLPEDYQANYDYIEEEDQFNLDFSDDALSLYELASLFIMSKGLGEEFTNFINKY